MNKLPGLRFAAGILFICIGLASIFHFGPAAFLWWSTQSVQLYVILLLLGIGILIIPYFYRAAGAEKNIKAAVLKFDFALVLSATSVGLMLLLSLIADSNHWANLQWIPLVLVAYIVVCTVLFQRANPNIRFARY